MTVVVSEIASLSVPQLVTGCRFDVLLLRHARKIASLYSHITLL